MIEKKIYQEIPGGRNKFHSAILTSFSFNFHHFENQVLRTLRQKWVSSIMVLADQRMLDNELGVASGNLKYLSQSYSVTGVESKGAFHPKINFLIGDNQLLLFFGSGNITSGGHGKNHELFTGFYADKNNQIQLPIILEAWSYILSIAEHLEGYNRDRLFRVLPGTCSLIGTRDHLRHEFYRIDDEVEVALLYHDDSTISQQLVNLIPQEEVTQITVVSPYYDEDGAALLNFKNHFNRAKLSVYLPSKYGLPPNKIKNHQAIEFYEWEKTKRGKAPISSTEDYYRKLHCKIIHFQAGDQEYCLIGSANATVAGLGNLSGKALNEEFCALYKLTPNGFLQKLGITGKTQAITVTELIRNDSHITNPDEPKQNKQARILCADLNGRRLHIKHQSATGIELYLTICESNASKLYRELYEAADIDSTSLTLSDNILIQNPSYIVFESDTGDEISNKQLINIIDKLYHTDPSRGNRNIRQVLTSLDGGSINEFEIIDFINDLNKSRESSSMKGSVQGSSSQKIQNENEISAAEMTYDEAIEAAKDHQRSEVITRGHSSTRLWETISRLFKEKLTSIGEELMDEEEEGSAERSRDRDEADPDLEKILVKTDDHFKRMVNSVTKLADNYIGQLNRICYKPDHQISELDLGNFLLVTHILTVVCNFKEYEFVKDKNADSHLKELELLYTNKMLGILQHFTKLFIKLPFVKYKEDDYQKQKFDEFFPKASFHFWLYCYLLNHRSSHQVISDKVELLALNFIHYVDEPGKGFDQYLKTLSAAFNDMYFNPLSVVGFSDQILALYLNPEGNYIGIDHSGICKVLDDNGKEIEYNSIFAHGHTSHPKLKKHRVF